MGQRFQGNIGWVSHGWNDGYGLGCGRTGVAIKPSGGFSQEDCREEDDDKEEGRRGREARQPEKVFYGFQEDYARGKDDSLQQKNEE